MASSFSRRRTIPGASILQSQDLLVLMFAIFRCVCIGFLYSSRLQAIYNFERPGLELRRAYTTKWLTKINALHSDNFLPSFQDPQRLAKEIAEKTEGFSFAYMKELFLGFLLHYAHSGVGDTNSLELLFSQISNLKKQLENTYDEKGKEKEKAPGTGVRPTSRLIRFIRRLELVSQKSDGAQ